MCDREFHALLVLCDASDVAYNLNFYPVAATVTGSLVNNKALE